MRTEWPEPWTDCGPGTESIFCPGREQLTEGQFTGNNIGGIPEIGTIACDQEITVFHGQIDGILSGIGGMERKGPDRSCLAAGNEYQAGIHVPEAFLGHFPR